MELFGFKWCLHDGVGIFARREPRKMPGSLSHTCEGKEKKTAIFKPRRVPLLGPNHAVNPDFNSLWSWESEHCGVKVYHI